MGSTPKVIGYINAKELADLAGVDVSTLRRWRHDGLVPEPDKRTGKNNNQPWWAISTAKKWAKGRK